MPKRRTQDVVHAVMTDHYIQRRKPAGDLVADIPERAGPEAFYRGEELPYYPQPFPAAPQSELYLSVAQVHANNNSERGIPRLADAIDRYHPEQPDFYVELGDAMRHNAKPKDAIPRYQEALRLTPGSLAGLLGLGQAFDSVGDLARALDAFMRATNTAPDDAFSRAATSAKSYIRAGTANRCDPGTATRRWHSSRACLRHTMLSRCCYRNQAATQRERKPSGAKPSDFSPIIPRRG